MHLDDKLLQPQSVPLVDFSGTTTHTRDTTNLMIKWGPPSHFQQQLVTFIVVDCPAAYNIILSRPTLNVMKAQIRTFCNDMILDHS